MKLSDAGLIYCAVVWGATFYMVKDVLADIHPAVMVSYRFLLAAACVSPWILLKRNKSGLLRESFFLAVLLSALYISQTEGLRFTTASNSGFITGLFVLFVPLFLLIFFDKPPTRGQWAAVAVAVAGLWILTGGVRGFNRGDAMTLISAATYAGHLLATDKYVRADADAVLLAFHQFWMTGLLSGLFALFLGAPWGVGSGRAAVTVAFLALVPTLSAFYIQMLAQKTTSPIKVSLLFSLEPVFAAIFAWTLGGEAFLPGAAVGGGLIVLAMVIGELSKLPLLRGRKKEVLPV